MRRAVTISDAAIADRLATLLSWTTVLLFCKSEWLMTKPQHHNRRRATSNRIPSSTEYRRRLATGNERRATAAAREAFRLYRVAKPGEQQAIVRRAVTFSDAAIADRLATLLSWIATNCGGMGLSLRSTAQRKSSDQTKACAAAKGAFQLYRVQPLVRRATAISDASLADREISIAS